jgi:hypothetical protein
MRYLLGLLGVVLAAAALAAGSALAQTAGPGVRVSVTPAVEFNDHIEFGISVDPSTVSTSRTSPQLRGSLRTLTAAIEADRGMGDFQVSGSLAPAVQDYTGEEGFLDQFDGFRVPVVSRVVYRPSEAWPLLRLDARATRATRDAAIYDNWEPALEVGLGELLSYEFRRRVFDDTDGREDYLLINSTRHAGRASLRLAGGASTRVDAAYGLQRERYGSNLAELLYIAMGVDGDFTRDDTRHLADVTVLRVLSDRLLARVGASAMWNGSNSDFYDFRTSSLAALAFWSHGDGRWLRLEGRRSWLNYDGRATGGPFDGPTAPRKDASWQAILSGEYSLTDALSATASVDLLRNRTSDMRDVRDFLNYTQAIYRFGVSASH